MCTCEEVEQLRKKNLCCNCFEEEYLSNLMKNDGKLRRCSYCGKKRHSFKLENVAKLVGGAIFRHYYKTADNPDPADYTAYKEGGLEFERDGDPIYEVVAEIIKTKKDGIAEDICTILRKKYEYSDDSCDEENEFAEESLYACRESKNPVYCNNYGPPCLDADYKWREKWSAFKRSIKFEKRFFNPAVQSFLKDLFAGITEASQTSNGSRIIERVGPDTEMTHVYRARAFYNRADIEKTLCNPEVLLGPPPSSKTKAGRMNPAGIAFFYGANDPDVALSEVRPIVGSSVLVARFEILRPMRILNLDMLQYLIEEGSYFDPHYAERLSRKKFFPELWHDLLRPTMPGEEEMNYLPTQVLAEFLAAPDGLNIDGVRHTSVQAGDQGDNITFFHAHGDVRFVHRPKKLRVEWPFEIEDQPDIIVRDDDKQDGNQQSEDFYEYESLYNDNIELSLKLDTKNIMFYKINSAVINYSSQKVIWQVSESGAQHVEPSQDFNIE